MKNVICIFGLFAGVLAFANISPAGEGIIVSMPKTLVLELPKSAAAEQCIILNRTNPDFEHDLRSVPPHACVIVIGSWIKKTTFFFIPTEIASRDEAWKITWKDLNSPLVVGNRNWDVKVTTQGLKQFAAAVSYRF